MMDCTKTLEMYVGEWDEGMNSFINDKIARARMIFEFRSDKSYYHAHGLSIIDFLSAVMTQEKQDIEYASQVLRTSLDLCQKHRRKSGLRDKLSRVVSGTDYQSFSQDELHAELCYADILLYQSVLLLFQDDSLLNFVKSGLKIKSCFNMYKFCYDVSKTYSWESKILKESFDGGVKMGIGSFNLLISALPKRIVKLLEFIGFSGDESVGLKLLKEGSELKSSMRHIACSVLLLEYNLSSSYLIGNEDYDSEGCGHLLSCNFDKFQNGFLYLRYKARYEFTEGRLDQAVDYYVKLLATENVKTHVVAYWELVLLNIAQLNLKDAVYYADCLLEHSSWSVSVFSYLKAALLISADGCKTDVNKIDALMKEISVNKQKFAGKSLPFEKFVIKKSEKYFKEKWLCLPEVEILYMNGLFKAVNNNVELMNKFYRNIDKQLSVLDKNGRYYKESKCLIMFLKGACLRLMGQVNDAESCFMYVLNHSLYILHDTYLIPHTYMELGLLEQSKCNPKQAVKYFDIALKEYSHYPMETRVHFKIHLALTDKNKQ